MMIIINTINTLIKWNSNMLQYIYDILLTGDVTCIENYIQHCRGLRRVQ